MFKQVKLLFTAERKVCDQMFEGIESLRDQCFAEVTAGSVAMLLSFGDAIAKSKRSPEKLFVLLDMYEIMRELHNEVCVYEYDSVLTCYYKNILYNTLNTFRLSHFSEVKLVKTLENQL